MSQSATAVVASAPRSRLRESAVNVAASTSVTRSATRSGRRIDAGWTPVPTQMWTTIAAGKTSA